MASINEKQILSKLKRYCNSAEFQKEVDEHIDKYVFGEIKLSTAGGKTNKSPSEAADKFIEVLVNEIKAHAGSSYSDGEVGATAIAALTELEHDKPKKIGKNVYQIGVWFKDDLHRDSLAPSTFSGVDNIAALLNTGYSAGHAVYGVWKGHGDKRIRSLMEREGAHFIDNAIYNFNQNYASEYGVVNIILDDIYQ